MHDRSLSGRAGALPPVVTDAWPVPGSGLLRRSFDAVSTVVAGAMLRATARVTTRLQLDLRVEGSEHIPSDGPVLLAARHFHHLYDGVVLLEAVPRRLHILVGIDWVDSDWLRRLMEWATRTARWPAVLREEGLKPGADGVVPHPHSAFAVREVERFHMRSMRESVALLYTGAAVVVFPEGYPNVDPRFTPKRDMHEFLPFRRGFTTVAALAERRLRQPVPIVPVGLDYVPGRRWRVTARFGRSLYRDARMPRDEFIRLVQREVEALSVR